MATDYGQFILSLLQSYFPELELDSDSDMYAQIVQPIVDRLGASPLDTDLTTFIPQRIKEEYPALKVDEAGAALTDMVINPTILIFDAFKRELQAFRASKSLRDLSAMSDDEMDALLANVFVERRLGTRATGTARVYFSTPVTILADPSSTFTAKNNQVFVASTPQTISSSDMALNVDGDLYYADIDVLSILEDEDANIDAGELMTAEGMPSAVRVTNLASFTGATTTETSLALAARAETLITERSLVTERGIKTTVLQENSEIADLSVVGMHDTEMTRDILRGELRATADLGHGPAYAGGHDARFSKSTALTVWAPERFPLNDQVENLGPGTRDWHQDTPAIGDQISCEGFPYDVVEVVAGWEDATVRFGIEVLASSDDLAVGGTSLIAGVGPYLGDSLIGPHVPHAPLFCTNQFYAGGDPTSVMSASINPATDFLMVRDTTYEDSGPPTYSRTKYWPIEKIVGNNVQVYSNNEHYRLQELRIKVGSGPDVRQASWWLNGGQGITADYEYGGVSLELAQVIEVGGPTINYLAVELTPVGAGGPTGGFHGVGVDISPGDIITLFTTTLAQDSVAGVLWFEARIKYIDSNGKIFLSATDEWLIRHFPDVRFATPGDAYDVLGPIGAWGDVRRFYWSIREGTGSGSSIPYSKHGWASSFLPAWDLPTGYTWNSQAAGYSTKYRQPGEFFPEPRTNTHATTFSSFQPWGDLPAGLKTTDSWAWVAKTEWAIVRFPTAKLPAFDYTEWTLPLATPTAHDQYPFGAVAIEEPITGSVQGYDDRGEIDTYIAGVMTDATKAWTVNEYVNYWAYIPTATGGTNWTLITANDATTFTGVALAGVNVGDWYFISRYRYVYYPVRFYGSNYMFGLPDDGDPAAGPTFATDTQDKDWVLRKNAAAITDGLSISLSQIPEITAPIEVPANEFHVGGMADVYGKPADAPEDSTMSLYPTLNFADSDVVLPATYTGAPATGGTTGAYGAAPGEDGKFTSSDLTAYTYQLGDLLVLLGPTTSPYYLQSYAIVGKPAAQSIRVYPAFSEASAIGSHTFVILRTVSVSLSPAKIYRVRGGTDLITNPGANTVSSALSNFITSGVTAGDTLAINEGRDQGTYSITGVQNNYLTLASDMVGNESGLFFDVYQDQGSLSLPVTKIKRMYLGTNRSRSGYYLPYGNPAGAMIEAPAMVGNSLAVPNSSNAGTEGSVDIATPFRFTDSSVDFSDAGVVAGNILYIKTGAHVGTYEVVAIETETLGPSVTQDMHLKLKGLTITETEIDLSYEVGPTAQGTARCYFFDTTRILMDPSTLFQNAEETRAYVPDPKTDATIFEEVTSDTDLFVYAEALAANAVYLRSTTVDFGTKGIKANSSADMGYSGDSDLVYLLHRPIISTGTITSSPLSLASRVLELEINGTSISYTFSENFEVEDVPAIVEKAFPRVELTWDAAETKYYLFSTSDVVIGTGDANDYLLFKDGDTNVVLGAAVGPHRIATNGITVWNNAAPPGVEGYPPLSATVLGQIELLKYDSDTDVVPDWSTYLNNTMIRVHVRIVRPGAQLFEETDMTAMGDYYYVDVDVASKYPGPDHLLTAGTSMAVTGAKPNGFTYVGDEDTSYSPLETIVVSLPTYYFDSVPVPILGGNLDIEYAHAPGIQTMHSFLTSKYYRTVCANILGLVSLPCEVYASVTYTGSKTTAEAEEEIRDYFESFTPGGTFTMRAFISAMKSRGLLVTSTPTVLVMEPDKQRRYWLRDVSETYTLPGTAAFLAIDLVVQRGY